MAARVALVYGLALVFAVAFPLTIFVFGPLWLRHRVGSSGWVRGLGSSAAERLANALFTAGCILDIANPAFATLGLVRPGALFAGSGIRVLSVATLVAALLLAVASQRAMGAAWRTGVDPGNPGLLITSGPFVVVRNPTYTSLLAASCALAVLVPTPLAAIAVGVCFVALQVQTRVVEEPHLQRVHGYRYTAYAARVGRFLPRIGRLRNVT